MWRDTFTWVTQLVFCEWHDSHICVPVCDMAHLIVFLRVTCFIHTKGSTWHNHMCPYVTQSDVFLRHTIRCVPMWHIHMCGIRHSHASWGSHMRHLTVLSKGHDSYWCVHTCDMAHFFVFLCVTCLLHMRSYLTHFVHVAWLNHMCHTTHFFQVAWLICMCSYVWRGTSFCVLVCDMLHTYVFLCGTFNMWLDTFTCATRLVFVEWNDSYLCVPTCGMVHFLVFLYAICLIHMCSHVWHGTFLCVTSATWRAMTSDMWRGSFIRVTWLIHACDMTHLHVWHDPFISVTWFSRMCDMTHSCGRHDSFMRVTWLIHMCDITHSYVWHDSFICVTWLIHMCDMTHSYVWHDSFICVISLIHAGDMTHSYVWYQQHVADDFRAKPWHFFISFFRVDNLALRTQEKTGSDQNIAPHRVAKMHRMSYLYRWFSAKELYH